MTNRRQFFCILLVLAMIAIPASGKDWQWANQSENGAIALGKEFLNEAIHRVNIGSHFSVSFGAIAIALFAYADHLETERHNAVEEEWQRQMLENTTIIARKLY